MIQQSSTKNIVNKTKKEMNVEIQHEVISDSHSSGSDMTKIISTNNNAFVKKENLTLQSKKGNVSHVKKQNKFKADIKSRTKINRKK